jgi:hypothetical protein
VRIVLVDHETAAAARNGPAGHGDCRATRSREKAQGPLGW